jgi:hypothetical protein
MFLIGVYVIAGAGFIFAPISYLAIGKQRVQGTARRLQERPGLAFLVGSGVVALIVALLFMCSKLGIAARSVGLIFCAISWIVLLFGYTAVSLWVTEKVRGEPGSVWWVALGAGFLTMLEIIPIVGILALIMFIPLAVGAASVSAYDRSRVWLSNREH